MTNKTLLITDTLNKDLYTTIKTTSRSALRWIDKNGNDLIRLECENEH